MSTVNRRAFFLIPIVGCVARPVADRRLGERSAPHRVIAVTVAPTETCDERTASAVYERIRRVLRHGEIEEIES